MAPMGVRGLIEIVTELENQLRETSASLTHEIPLIALVIRRGSILASFVPSKIPTFLSTTEICLDCDIPLYSILLTVNTDDQPKRYVRDEIRSKAMSILKIRGIVELVICKTFV